MIALKTECNHNRSESGNRCAIVLMRSAKIINSFRLSETVHRTHCVQYYWKHGCYNTYQLLMAPDYECLRPTSNRRITRIFINNPVTREPYLVFLSPS